MSLRAPVSVPGVLDSISETRSRRLVASVNGAYDMKLAKLQGAFIFHAHPDTDELFYVLSGALRIELQGVECGEVLLRAGDVFVVPRGVQHRPVLDEGVAEVMIVEKAGVVNTGDATGPAVKELTKGVVDARQ